MKYSNYSDHQLYGSVWLTQEIISLTCVFYLLFFKMKATISGLIEYT